MPITGGERGRGRQRREGRRGGRGTTGNPRETGTRGEFPRTRLASLCRGTKRNLQFVADSFRDPKENRRPARGDRPGRRVRRARRASADQDRPAPPDRRGLRGVPPVTAQVTLLVVASPRSSFQRTERLYADSCNHSRPPRTRRTPRTSGQRSKCKRFTCSGGRTPPRPDSALTRTCLARVPQPKTFPSLESMTRHASRDPEGTISYVAATGSLYVKVSQGWKEIQVLVQTAESKAKASRVNVPRPAAGQRHLRVRQRHPAGRGECRPARLLEHFGRITHLRNVSF